MADLKKIDSQRLFRLKEENKDSRIYKRHQLIGLMLADILKDDEHKSLYIKLAKQYNNEKLMSLAKDVASREGVEKRGAYFMKVLNLRIKSKEL